jgi:hypothetical protein
VNEILCRAISSIPAFVAEWAALLKVSSLHFWRKYFCIVANEDIITRAGLNITASHRPLAEQNADIAVY